MSQQVVLVRLGNRWKTAVRQVEVEGIAVFGLIGKSRKTLQEAVVDLLRCGSAVGVKELEEEIKAAKEAALRKPAVTEKVEPAPKQDSKKK